VSANTHTDASPFGAPIAVLGAGNWGTVLAQLAAESGHRVRLWTRNPIQAQEINTARTNKKAIAGLSLSSRIDATSNIVEAVEGAGMIVVVIPSQAFREVARRLGDVLDPRQIVLHATKGIELSTLRRMTEVLEEETCARQLGVLAGPNIAAEIAEGLPAGTVITSRFPHVVRAGKQVFTTGRFMVFGASDVVGVELCGALKNVVAIAAGIAAGMQIGENAMALLVTRGLAEITALATAMGARPGTLAGLAGAGDLMVTCRSHHSRNHRVGEALARGASLDEAVATLGMVAEGVTTAIAAKALCARHRIECPVLERVHRVLYERASPREALEELLRMRAGRDVPWA
jgi:glycerol-3-phosphate dehydrogenase (NAD(P)+)